MPRSAFLAILSERGFIHQCSDLDALDAALAAGPVAGYSGFDATAPSLHVGHLIQIMRLYWFQETGHKPVLLMGGATSRVGDPSFKDASRAILDDATIAANINTIRGVFEKFLGPDVPILNNMDWLGKLNYLDFLRDYGPHFTVNRMLSFDSVKTRLERESPLTLLEFNYMVLQAYDFLELYRRHGVRLQMGGSDQWGNMVNGLDLIRRSEGAEAFVLTSPLLTTADGKKMGKSECGAVWLNADMLSPYEYYQYWRNVADTDVGRFLRLFTVLPVSEIERLEALRGQEVNEAKKILAFEATRLAHGGGFAFDAVDTARSVFEERGVGSALPKITADLMCGVPVVDLLVDTGLCASKSAAKRLIAQGGVRVDGVPVVGQDYICTSDKPIKLSAGKKRHAEVWPT
ncbi:MAG TPA: tyrosine--tRNA ligase [Rhodospirillaceae bacterium]|jgi:tyrosyl-tRNA synthetase|nr:tyrosine--tRNA ligase [Alphaproteobacteria bacterium]HBH26346.1 tyrosine--tRNA ligase [Rhodospirillaceae bacterium]